MSSRKAATGKRAAGEIIFTMERRFPIAEESRGVKKATQRRPQD
jgi:hypothetical protein